MIFAPGYRAMYPESNAVEMRMQWMDLDENGGIIKEVLLLHRDPLAKVVTGEASANTFAQVPPERLKSAYPEAKLILCLRHPVDRAFSHYQMLQRFVTEGRRIPLRLTDFKSDFLTDITRTKTNGKGYFAELSFYAERLKNWARIFGEERISIVRTEDLSEKETAQRILSDLCGFLNIRDYEFSDVLKFIINKSGNSVLDPILRRELFGYYERDVQKLEEFTGRKFNWIS